MVLQGPTIFQDRSMRENVMSKFLITISWRVIFRRSNLPSESNSLFDILGRQHNRSFQRVLRGETLGPRERESALVIDFTKWYFSERLHSSLQIQHFLIEAACMPVRRFSCFFDVEAPWCFSIVRIV